MSLTSHLGIDFCKVMIFLSCAGAALGIYAIRSERARQYIFSHYTISCVMVCGMLTAPMFAATILMNKRWGDPVGLFVAIVLFYLLHRACKSDMPQPSDTSTPWPR